ncbi:sugar phosphate isomerase/epimerase family protein [Microvirga aerophila]|uniref:Xylose isomerase n=1 Tax=Microvirga aerophila TaxID=670291 RepID=A0A512BY87_9HYPH|nr:sugar phosphate isomerase/epimerase [Microvirga aerophila]GEO16921.1 xylose isomerase [Microvirga aerophila]
MTPTRLSLSHLSALEVPPPHLVSLAADTGYWAVGLRLNPAAPGAISYPLRPGTVEMAETKRRMKDTGVAVYDVEFIPLTPTIDISSYADMFEGAAELGAQRVNVSGDDPEFSRLVFHFAEICELASTFGLGVDLEFMRWRHVGSLPQAAEIVRQAGAHNGGILLDALHLFRSGGSPADVRALKSGLIRSAQLCDAPAAAPPPEGIIEEARNHRLSPGEGELPLRELVRGLQPGVALAVEVPMPPSAGLTPQAHVQRIRKAAEELLGSDVGHDRIGQSMPHSAASTK